MATENRFALADGAVAVALQLAGSAIAAVFAPGVPTLAFSEALALTGLVGQFDADRRVLVIKPAQGLRAHSRRSRPMPRHGNPGRPSSERHTS